jgi:hypothetical protein
LHVPPIRKSLCLVREPAGRDDEPSCGALSSHGPVQLSHHVYANALRTPLLALHKVQFTVAPQFQINSSVWSSLPGFADLKALPAKTFAHQLSHLLHHKHSPSSTRRSIAYAELAEGKGAA